MGDAAGKPKRTSGCDRRTGVVVPAFQSTAGCYHPGIANRGTAMRRQLGFTLIELMIVVMVIAILAAIAIPNYLEQSRKGRRSEAMNAVGDVKMALERWRAEHTSYASCGTCTNNVSTDNYTVTISGESGTAYTITATKKGKQANDRCGNLVATQSTKPTWSGDSDCNN